MYDWKSFSFGSGSHETREQGMCVMEAVSYVAGEAHTDRPVCACPIISSFCRSWNDSLRSDEERAKWLGEFVWRLPGTKSTPEIELQRSWMAFDWMVRELVPSFMELTPELQAHAESLRELPEVGPGSFDAVVPILQSARAAARDAAGDAAGAAAWAAARAAAWAAAWAAAGAAARDAAGAAAADALEPTVQKLQQSARDLLDRMVRLTEPQEAVVNLAATPELLGN